MVGLKKKICAKIKRPIQNIILFNETPYEKKERICRQIAKKDFRVEYLGAKLRDFYGIDWNFLNRAVSNHLNQQTKNNQESRIHFPEAIVKDHGLISLIENVLGKYSLPIGYENRKQIRFDIAWEIAERTKTYLKVPLEFR